ncbi:hypothetical protein Pmani_029065 [Petrolisthes manimaculis]|uniref:Uncharacterized protein n=1 Tax=Petrolisthes manimaculis TaxID=1843537 RepID=A0AAE1NYC4_9EUCA|nr:hypothetical protein Pmani_029065 [Petrolisthes manimaculis]
MGAAAARDENGGGVAAAVVDSDDGAADPPVSVTGVAMSLAGGVPSLRRRYAAAASAGDRSVSGGGKGATQPQAKYLRKTLLEPHLSMLYDIPGYSMFNNPRNAHGGGVALNVSDKF